jgi:hypothetical protein
MRKNPSRIRGYEVNNRLLLQERRKGITGGVSARWNGGAVCRKKKKGKDLI